MNRNWFLNFLYKKMYFSFNEFHFNFFYAFFGNCRFILELFFEKILLVSIFFLFKNIFHRKKKNETI